MGLRDDAGMKPDRQASVARSEDWDTGHYVHRFWCHFIIGVAAIDAYVFRQRLVPELVSTLPALAQQALRLAACAAAAALLAGIAFLFSRRTARSFTWAYMAGAFLFAGFTLAMLVDDYHRYAEPGTFTERMNVALEKIKTYAAALRGQ
jgi:hypothetical protein